MLISEQNLAHWDWVKWLPHAQSDPAEPTRSDRCGWCRRRSTTWRRCCRRTSANDRASAPTSAPPTPHLLLVIDGGHLPPGNHVVPPDGLHGVTVLDLPARWDELDDASCLRLPSTRRAGRAAGRHPMLALRVREAPVRALADQCDQATAEAFARRLTPLHAVTAGVSDTASGEITGPSDFMDLLGLGDVFTFDPAPAWRPRPARDRLRVPIGLGDGGALIHLDIKESAQQGMGPHGLVIGATGSGKSEFLRTLVLGLAMTHSPEQLNFVLVDFKGGATFAGMAELPHVSAVITNLAQELTLVDRMQDALSGEMVRRQELLREAGNYASIRDYEKARAAGEPLEPLPSLFIVVDEFSEMLTAKPEFIDLFVAIGRLGRSLGVHLLLASQRLEEGRLRGLESHLSYRVGLRTFCAAESRARARRARRLRAAARAGPRATSSPTSRRCCGSRRRTSRGRRRRGPGSRRDEGGQVHGILPFTISEVLHPGAAAAGRARARGRATAEASRTRCSTSRSSGWRVTGPAAHQVWLPPLDVPDTLDDLMADLDRGPRRSASSRREWRKLGGLVIPLGTVDRPREQRRDTLTINLAGAAGHVVVVGGPRSGKSTLLRTMVTSMALTTTPLESQFYVLDFGGGAFAPMAGLPHVAGIGSRSEPDVVRRIVAEVTGIVDRREAYFRAHGIDSIETYRSRRGAGPGRRRLRRRVPRRRRLEHAARRLRRPRAGPPAARQPRPHLRLPPRGRAAARWADFRAAMRDVFGTRLELRLGDPLDSEIDRKVAALVPAGRPGRGLVPGKLHFLAALPRIDGNPDTDNLGDGVDDLIKRVGAAWNGPAGPQAAAAAETVIGLDAIRSPRPDR